MTGEKVAGKTLEEWFEEGIRCFKKPDGMGAVKAFETILAADPLYRHPDGDNPYFYLGKISEVENRLDDAIDYYTKSLSLDPMDEESLIGRGSCYTVRNRFDEAIADFRKILVIDPHLRRVPLRDVFYAVAETCRKKGDYPETLKWGEWAVKEDPDNFRNLELVTTVRRKLAETP